jgi:membrane-bound metal-dependent hydrolase YbcI (DUF457 family)
MAGFKAHITTSTAIGIGYGVAGYFYLHAPIETCVLAGGLCSVSGMLPDLDSDSGTPVREMSCFAAAVVPMLMLERFQGFGWSREMIVLAAAVIYVVIRFGLVEIFKRYTVHRGMWHSIPACLTCGLIAFLIVSGDDLTIRLFKSGGVVLGFLSHLILDEIWSVSVRSGRLNIKKSSGTAMKFWGKDSWANFSTYAKLIVLAGLAVGDPMLMNHFGHEPHFGNETAQQVVDRALNMAGIQRPQQPDDTIQR